MRHGLAQALIALFLAGAVGGCHLYIGEDEEPPRSGGGTEATPDSTDPDSGQEPDPGTAPELDCFPEELLGGPHPQCNGFETNQDCPRDICEWCGGVCVSEELWDRELCRAFEEGELCEASTCQGEVVCADEAPQCPAGSTPEIAAGCYTGTCMLKSDCPDGAPFACSDLNDSEEACVANDACEPVYRGVDCTSASGEPCSSASTDCSCASFEFDACG